MTNSLDFAPAALPIDDSAALQRVRMDDHDELFGIVSEEFDRLDPWLKLTEKWGEKKAADVCMEADELSMCGRGADFWMVQGADKAGYVELRPERRFDYAWSMTYWVRSSFTGQQLARRAIGTMSNFVFSEQDADSLVFWIGPKNIGSQRCAMQSGAVIVPGVVVDGNQAWRLDRE